MMKIRIRDGICSTDGAVASVLLPCVFRESRCSLTVQEEKVPRAYYSEKRQNAITCFSKLC